jgi:tRNA (guanine-N7-)-methyltransferase
MSQAAQVKLEQRLQPFLWAQDRIRNSQEVEVEIGMGNGLAMLERAKARPARLFIGAEVYLNGLRSLVYRLEQAPAVKNVQIAPVDARAFLPEVPPASVDRLLIPYPDPWPKARHHKRRLVRTDFLTACARVLKPTGELWVMTDIKEYADWVAEQATAHGVFDLAVGHTPPQWWGTTKYEQKAVREGRRPTYICGVKKLDL